MRRWSEKVGGARAQRRDGGDQLRDGQSAQPAECAKGVCASDLLSGDRAPDMGGLMTTKWTLTIDCTHPPTLAAFWKLALGYVEAAPPQGFDSRQQWLTHFGVPEAEWDDVAYLADPDGVQPRISFLKVPEPKVLKNRVHLDVQVGGGRGEPWDVRLPRVTEAVRRLTAAGGTVIREDELEDGTPDHVVMADPEGNEFCVL
jgi:glyoxalase superfamily protein